MDFFEQISNYTERLMKEISKIDKDVINELINLIIKIRDERKQIFIMGNGGSGASASHIAGDFNKGLSINKPEDKRYRVISLVDNSPTVLSLANDVSYDNIFKEQLKNFLNTGDLVICISGSGNSVNVVKAAEYTKENGGVVVGFTGFSGGKLKDISDIRIHVAIDDMQVVEDVHMMLGHLIFSVLYHIDF